MKQYEETLQQSIQKALVRVEKLKDDTNANLSNMKDDFKDRLGDMDKYYQEMFEEANSAIESVKIMARDSVNSKEKELADMMQKKTQTIQQFMDQNIDDMVQERKVTLAKYEKQFNQIKQVCCKYFERYDMELEAVQIKSQNVME